MAIFYVQQGISYDQEYAGGYVWSPQRTKNGSKNSGYTALTYIKKGDFIIHVKNGLIKAVSIAKTDCYDAIIPRGLSTDLWDDKGYKVDTTYHPVSARVNTRDYSNWFKAHYSKNSPFGIDGYGKQLYMSTIPQEQADFIITKLLDGEPDGPTRTILQAILGDFSTEEEYTEADNIAIEELITSAQPTPAPTTPTAASSQEVIHSTGTGRDIPKRKSEVAAAALLYADYKCEYDPADRTFTRKNGKPYTEPHHLIPLSRYREFDRSLDVRENIVSLCSHCHNLLHYGSMKEKEPVLMKLYNDRINQLKAYGIDITFDQLKNYYQ